jgi:2-amino-4-hydroxy-6-hydroxymethyldihydropteridine diphosphokinase
MLRSAVAKLQAPDLRLLRVSRIYETEPVGLREQPWFLNAVAEFESELSPHQLMERAQGVERELGRVRTVRNGPRNIDVDLLLCGDAVVNTPELTVPHPRYRERWFVLDPLLELNPDLCDPVTGQKLIEVLNRLVGQAFQPAAWLPPGVSR